MSAEQDLTDLCAAFDVTRSGDHAWRIAEPSARELADAHIPEYYRMVAQQHSEIGTNSAHQLATQWLAAVGVDVQRLEEMCPHQIFPEFALHPGIAITNAAELMGIPDKVPQRHPLMARLNVTD